MLGHRELTMQEYVGILKRRWRLILICAALLLGVGLGLSYILPPKYMSQTLVLIEQQKVPEDYVRPVVDEDLGARLATMKEQILSRSRIEPIIERFNLYSTGKYTMDDRVDMTRKAIGINPIAPGGGHHMPGFFVTFTAQDAHTAQQVCGEITSLFVSANLNAREQSAEGTTDFLKQQLADAKKNLDDQDSKLAAFEEKNIGKLPGQTVHIGDMSVAMGSPSEGTLQALTSQLDANTQAMNRLQQDDTFLEAMIAQQSQSSSQTDSATGSSEEAIETELKEATKQEKELETLYTPNHPDVLAIKRKIANLQAERAHLAAQPVKGVDTPKASDSQQLQQLKAQLRAERQSMASAKQEQAQLEAQIHAYEARIEASPIVEEEYKQITRDHDTALQFYNSLLGKMNESTMATALEHRQEGEQFRVMDAPNLPDAPSFPNHRIFAAGGLGVGLALGLLLAGLLEYRDTSLRNESDIWAFTKLPTLAVVSFIDDLAPAQSAGKRWKLFSRTAKAVESARG